MLTLRSIIFSLLYHFSWSIYACNRPLLNHFYLNGMSHSASDPMKVCTAVKDKCCTIADEVKLTNFWMQRSEPMLSARASLVGLYLRRALESFNDVMEFDPKDIIFKYTVKRMVPYEYKICQTVNKFLGPNELAQFNKAHDKHNMVMYKSIHKAMSPNEPFKLTNFTHNKYGERTWGAKYSNSYEMFVPTNKTFDQVPDVGTREFMRPQVTCYLHKTSYLKEFVIVNQEKAGFCLRLYENFLNFDIKKFISLLPSVKSSLNQIVESKKSLYCFLCDAHSQSYFDLAKREIAFSHKFCRDIINTHRDYINFMHVIFVEYADSLLQYIACFETNAKVLPLPYPNFLVKYRRRISLVKRCLDKIGESDYLLNCWFLCNKFSLHQISPFWDGDLDLLIRLYTTVGSFLRKIQVEKQEEEKFDIFKRDAGKRPVFTTTGNVDGLLIEPLIEPLNPGNLLTDKQYYMEAKDMMKLMNTTDTRDYVNPEVSNVLSQFLDKIGVEDASQAFRLQTENELLQQKLTNMTRNISNSSGINSTVSQINGLINQLQEILTKDKLHSGYFPRKLNQEDPEDLARSLREIRPIAYNLSDFINGKHSMKVLPTFPKSKKKKIPIIAPPSVEVPNQIYEKVDGEMNIHFFKTTLATEGLNPIFGAAYTHFSYNITAILEEAFKKDEKLSIATINAFFATNNKGINRFNNDIDDYYTSWLELPDLTLIKKIKRYAMKRNNVALLNKVAKVEKEVLGKHAAAKSELDRKHNYTKMLKTMSMIKANYEQLKALESKNRTDHVHVKHFDKNFNGIANLFTGIFGN